jgi:hypothetical protein
MPKQALTTTKKNEVALSGGLAFQNQLLSELDKANQEFGANFTPYGKTCAINCIAGIVSFSKANGIELNKIDPTLLRLQVQNVGFTELNYASIPSEIYFDLRKTTMKDKDGNDKEGYTIAIKPQGAGNEKLVRKYGVGLKKGSGLRNAILIREGDEFIMPQFNGLEMTPPVYKPQLKNANNKVIAVVYPAEKEDGSVEYLIATRDSVKANLIAQIRQNTLYAFKTTYVNKYGKECEKNDKEARDKFYEELDKKAENMTLDEMLADEELLKYINPTYTSGGSKEQMILRKMKNNALKNYPKEYDTSFIKNAVENMFEEKDESVLERKNVVERVERELDEDLNDDVIMDFSVNEEVDKSVDKSVDKAVDKKDESDMFSE